MKFREDISIPPGLKPSLYLKTKHFCIFLLNPPKLPNTPFCLYHVWLA